MDLFTRKGNVFNTKISHRIRVVVNKLELCKSSRSSDQFMKLMSFKLKLKCTFSQCFLVNTKFNLFDQHLVVKFQLFAF